MISAFSGIEKGEEAKRFASLEGHNNLGRRLITISIIYITPVWPDWTHISVESLIRSPSWLHSYLTIRYADHEFWRDLKIHSIFIHTAKRRDFIKNLVFSQWSDRWLVQEIPILLPFTILRTSKHPEFIVDLSRLRRRLLRRKESRMKADHKALDQQDNIIKLATSCNGLSNLSGTTDADSDNQGSVTFFKSGQEDYAYRVIFENHLILRQFRQG